MTVKKKHKLDIFDVLKRLSNKDRDFTVEEEKELQPIVIMRWLSGTKSERQIYLINQTVNKYSFSFYEHKKLLINLMTISCNGFQRYKWLKRKTSQVKTKKTLQIISEYYDYPLRHCSDAANILDSDTILEHALELGKPKEFIRDLKKELKSR